MIYLWALVAGIGLFLTGVCVGVITVKTRKRSEKAR
jgi:hypothetical protein